jgi:hypothetical protein
MEAMGEHWQSLRQRMRQAGLPALGKLPSKNVRRTGDSDLSQYFSNDQLIGLAWNRYRQDVEVFYGEQELEQLAHGRLSATPQPLERLPVTAPV